MLQNNHSRVFAASSSGAIARGAATALAAVSRPVAATNRIERTLLAAVLALLPLEKHVPRIGPLSLPALLFGILTLYVLWNRPRTLARVWWHPIFRAAYFFLFIGALVEMMHPHTSLGILNRILLMFLGATIIATLCRDRAALYTALHAYILAGFGVSLFLIFKGFNSLHSAVASDYKQATQLRANTFQTDFHFELGLLSYQAGQGAMVALAFALAARTPRHRYFYLLCGLFCLVGTFIPLSRGGVAITGLACITVVILYLLAHPSRQMRTIIAALVVVATLFIVVPESATQRFQFSTAEKSNGKMEGRARIYTSAITYFPEYVVNGVGSGNYWQAWAEHTSFEKNDFGKIDGPHNCFIASTVYWGMAGCLALAVVAWQAYRCVPRRHREDILAICIYGLAVGWFLRINVVHTLYGKEFAFAFGLLAASGRWLWPKGTPPGSTPPAGVLPVAGRNAKFRPQQRLKAPNG